MPALPSPDEHAFRCHIGLERLLFGEAPPRRRKECRGGDGAFVRGVPYNERPRFSALALRQTQLAALQRGDGAIRTADLREKIVERRQRLGVVFVVDASSSMRRQGRMSRVKALLWDYLDELHVARGIGALVAFRHDKTHLAAPPTPNASRLRRAMALLEVGGRTPLASGMAQGLKVLDVVHHKDPHGLMAMVVISDGRPNLTIKGGHPFDEAVAVARAIGRQKIAFGFVDTDADPMASGCGFDVAQAAAGRYEFLTAVMKRAQ